MTIAIVVGSGPNGLAAATVLARQGVEVTVIEANEMLGGGARSGESPTPGLLQDHCAAVHPMAPGSPFFQSLNLTKMGIEWEYAPLDAAHPLDGQPAALLHTRMEDTVAGLGVDGARWKSMFDIKHQSFSKLVRMMMSPIMRIPRHPLLLARFGLVAGPPPSRVVRKFKTESARALFMGVAAHAMQPLNKPLVTGIGAGIITAGHQVGWPVVKGGTGKLTQAHIESLRAMGVKFVTGQKITNFEQLPPHDIAMLDVHPHVAAQILRDQQPKRFQKAFTSFKPGPGIFKVDFAVSEGIPWSDPEVGRAGSVHLGGSAKEIMRTEKAVASGKMPKRPFVLVGQQYLADPQRVKNGIVPIYAYAHVPNGYQGDATDQIIAQIERFAPGFKDRIVAMRSRTPQESEEDNPNFIGGDVLTGAKSPLQFMFGPKIGAHPYDTGVPHVYICSAATPPGPGIHGMSGYNAATRALKKLK
ncbi:MAG TPA: NAD(P)/FAD-dependent oxidoreductase [Microbacteriaceae bacterium]|nr:NAD(P)/FAD-dependent oxidoreductase [Microbacteriaceae bacterium]